MPPDPCRPFREVLGDAFETLTPGLRAAHADSVLARGRATVRRGRNPIAWLLATVAGLPPAGESLPVEMSVRPDGPRLRWERTFGGARMSSTVTARRGLLVERVGPSALGFRLEPAGETVVWRHVATWIGPLRIPRFLGPRVTCVVTDRGTGWHLDLETRAAGAGMVCRVEAEMHPVDPESASTAPPRNL